MRLAIAAAAGILGFANTAFADAMLLSGRIGPTLGVYQQEFAFSLRDASTGEVLDLPECGGPCQASGDESELAYGLQTGLSALFGDFFLDAGIELLAVNSDADLDRTDLLFTAGYFIGQHWQAFAGYRMGMQGDGFFDDDTFSERGFFVGAGIGGMEVGDFMLGASLAYNFSEAQDFPQDGEKFDYGGLSFKLNGQLKSLPQHSLQLRVQRFTGDERTTEGGVTLDIEDLTESYVQLTYLYSFSL
jgi:hypothetical protein